MKTQRYDGSLERQVLTAMLVSDAALTRIRPRWERDLFPSPMAQTLSTLCCRHFDRYKKAPGPSTEQIFLDWATARNGDADKSVVQLVESYLGQLSGEYERLAEEVNPDVAADQAGKLFNMTRVKALYSRGQEHLENGEVDKALADLASFAPVAVGVGSGTNLDNDFVDRVLARDRLDSLVDYGEGPLGKFLSKAFCRHDFVSFFGKTGVGKSFWMLDVAYRAAKQGRRVLYLEAGDMGEADTGARILSRLTKRPQESGPVFMPEDIERHDNDKYATTNGREEHMDAYNPEMARKAVAKWDGQLRLHCFNARSTSAQGVEAIIEQESRNGFEPDVVVLDYADILCPSTGEGKLDKRDQINERWLHLRSLPQKYHCLLVTATQADAKSYNGKLLGLDNFSDDRRKNDHVTAMIGINQDKDEQEQGIVRLNYVKRRKGAFATSRVVHVAGCLALAAPALRSCF